jgi:hypothetical protein
VVKYCSKTRQPDESPHREKNELARNRKEEEEEEKGRRRKGGV